LQELSNLQIPLLLSHMVINVCETSSTLFLQIPLGWCVSRVFVKELRINTFVSKCRFQASKHVSVINMVNMPSTLSTIMEWHWRHWSSETAAFPYRNTAGASSAFHAVPYKDTSSKHSQIRATTCYHTHANTF